MDRNVDMNNILMSIISTFNIYINTGETIDTISRGRALKIRHINTGEYYYCVKLEKPNTDYSLDNWRDIIWHPADKNFLWPIDIINVLDKSSMKISYYLVYPFVVIPSTVTLESIMSNDSIIGLEKPKVKNLVRNICTSFDSFYSKGNQRQEDKKDNLYNSEPNHYLYVAWNEKNILIDSNENPYMVFNNIMNSVERDYTTGQPYIKADKYTGDLSEYYDPYIFANKGDYTVQSELYALAAMIFKLLIGKYPYEGGLMDGVSRSSQTEKKHWYNMYLSHPVFIFDSNDKRNAIGDFKHEQIYTDRWNSLTPELRSLFENVFNENNVMRRNDTVNAYSPRIWLNALNQFDFRLNQG
ncbi:MAG: hypothetical protein ACI4RM_07325 [Ruminococcus sp.]